MANKRYVYWGTIGLGLALGIGLVSMEPVAGPQKAERRLVAPTFKVDPFWPKPLPDNWVTGEPGGTCIDSQDHLIIVTRGFQTGGLASPEGVGGADTKTGTLGGAFKSKASPPVIEFDTEGKVARAWGDPSLTMSGSAAMRMASCRSGATTAAPSCSRSALSLPATTRRQWLAAETLP